MVHHKTEKQEKKASAHKEEKKHEMKGKMANCEKMGHKNKKK
jgi:hypothetical protein